MRKQLGLFFTIILICNSAYAFPPATPYDKKQPIIDYIAAKDCGTPITIFATGEFKDGGLSTVKTWQETNHPNVELYINMGDYIPNAPPDPDAAWDTWETDAGTWLTNAIPIHLPVRGDQEDVTRFTSFYDMPDDYYFDVCTHRIMIRSQSRDGTLTKLTDDTTDTFQNIIDDAVTNNLNVIVFDYKQHTGRPAFNSWETEPANCEGTKFYIDTEAEVNEDQMDTYRNGNIRAVFSADNQGDCEIERRGVWWIRADGQKSSVQYSYILRVFRDTMEMKRINWSTNVTERYMHLGNSNRR